jgi:Domain of unknown function (DUF4169)
MAEIINLKQQRKQKSRAEAEMQAAANREKFGRTKSEKQLHKLETVQSQKQLDGHKRDKP